MAADLPVPGSCPWCWTRTRRLPGLPRLVPVRWSAEQSPHPGGSPCRSPWMLCEHESVLWLPKCWVLAASDTEQGAEGGDDLPWVLIETCEFRGQRPAFMSTFCPTP